MLRTFVIAEAGVNHNGDPLQAFALVDAAVKAGADAVKFQTFRASKLATASAGKATYQKEKTGADESQCQMLKKLELDFETFRQLQHYSTEQGIAFMSTAFDDESFRFLVDELGLRRLKIPSGEITNGPFILEHARRAQKLILSTGMSSLADIEAALQIIAYGFLRPSEADVPNQQDLWHAYNSTEGRRLLQERVVVLHCLTEYPAPLSDVNLRAMDTLRAAFDLPVGYSDHTEGGTVSLAAVARGAVVIEKHFTLDRCLPGPDHAASLEPAELKQMIDAIREVEQALGQSVKSPALSELPNRTVARKSLVATDRISVGERFTVANLGAMRPGTGITPMRHWEFLGRTARRNYAQGDLIDE